MMTIANMRGLGVRHVTLWCTVECNHHVDICVDGWDEATEVPTIGKCYRCTKCGRRSPESRPAWHRREGTAVGPA